MEQEKLGLAFGMMKGAQAVPTETVKKCKTVKQAVRMQWAMRRIKGMTQRHCASICGFYAPHFSQWLKEGMPDMPAKHFQAFNAATGLTLVSQFVAMEAGLTIIEEVQANIQEQRRAA